ncbi:hypothetical protein GN956_G13406 [Arapaima gigas]
MAVGEAHRQDYNSIDPAGDENPHLAHADGEGTSQPPPFGVCGLTFLLAAARSPSVPAPPARVLEVRAPARGGGSRAVAENKHIGGCRSLGVEAFWRLRILAPWSSWSSRSPWSRSPWSSMSTGRSRFWGETHDPGCITVSSPEKKRVTGILDRRPGGSDSAVGETRTGDLEEPSAVLGCFLEPKNSLRASGG